MSDAAPTLQAWKDHRTFQRVPGVGLSLEGWVETYLSAISEQWLKVAPFSNPAMLEMISDRDREPARELLPWSGEFAGKYLTSAVQVYRVTRDDSLRQVITEFVGRLTALQAEDGYLGPWSTKDQLTGTAPNVAFHFPSDLSLPEGFLDERRTWDTWGLYHAMLGLLLWFEESDDVAALDAARRIGDLLHSTFEDMPLIDFNMDVPVLNTTEMNQAPIHSLALLYQHTGDERYLWLATKIREEFSTTTADGTPIAGDYVEGPLSGKAFFELAKPRWESLHPIMGLAELYGITGDERSRRAFEATWWSIVKNDRHNNGGFSSGEQAVGNPYSGLPIETCCTIAWLAMTVEMLRLTGDSVVADELELSTLNSVVGMHSISGRWVTYNTPMDGVRLASAHDLVFQAREGSPELNCCSVNGARGFGMLSDWAVMAADGGLAVNWYGPGWMTAQIRDGRVRLHQDTDYPRNNQVQITLELDRARAFPLRLRIPSWSSSTVVQVNGRDIDDVAPGRYLVLDREWRTGDVIAIEFDFTLQYWAGERECTGKASVYRGPILLAYDRRFNAVDPGELPLLDGGAASGTVVDFDGWLPPVVLVEHATVGGGVLRLCDFGSAGAGGSVYRSWLAIDACPATKFTPENPRRSRAVAD